MRDAKEVDTAVMLARDPYERPDTAQNKPLERNAAQVQYAQRVCKRRAKGEQRMHACAMMRESEERRMNRCESHEERVRCAFTSKWETRRLVGCTAIRRAKEATRGVFGMCLCATREGAPVCVCDKRGCTWMSRDARVYVCISAYASWMKMQMQIRISPC